MAISKGTCAPATKYPPMRGNVKPGGPRPRLQWAGDGDKVCPSTDRQSGAGMTYLILGRQSGPARQAILTPVNGAARVAAFASPPREVGCSMLGTIKRFMRDIGYGFIRTRDGRNVFFHRNDLRELDFASLKEGESVEVEVEMGPKGLRAVSVRPGKPEAG
jgi:cold shock protein